MDPVLRAVLLSWDWRADVLLTLAAAGTLYYRGWSQLRQRAGRHVGQGERSETLSSRRSAAAWRPAVYITGLSIIALALVSPIDVLAGQLFSVHMVQHLLLIMIAPPLLLIANPLPFLLWGLPGGLRRPAGRTLGRLLAGTSPYRKKLQSLTSPGVVWMIWVISVIGWHDPGAYDAALRSPLIHDLEHISFFAAGMLYWWHVTGAGPRIHRRANLVVRIAYVLSIIPPNMVAGVALAFAQEPIYAYGSNGFLGLSALDDQQLGGVIMWIPGSMMYIVAALILTSRLLQQEYVKPPLPESQWGTEANLIAPGLEK